MLERLSIRQRVLILAGAVTGMLLVAGIAVFALQHASGTSAHGANLATPTPVATQKAQAPNPLSCNPDGKQPALKLKGHTLPVCR